MDVEMEYENEAFEDWFSDNRIELMSDFLENHLDVEKTQEWEDFKKAEFKEWRENR